MTDLAQILEEELEEAVEVKDKKSLHRYITLLTNNLVKKEDNQMDHTEFQLELIKIDGRFKQMITEVKEGFKRMDQRFESIQQQIDRRFEASDNRFEASDNRFEAMDKRFEAMERHFDKRFSMMFSFITIGFVVMATMMSVFQFLG